MAAYRAATPAPILVLIHPPIVKPSEPPAGLAKLSGALRRHSVGHLLIDANIEGMLGLIHDASASAGNLPETWARRAARNVSRNLDLLRDRRLYADFSRYKRAVADTNHLLRLRGGQRFHLTLADYSDRELSPIRSSDLLRAAEKPEENPFFPYFSERLAALVESHPTLKMAGISLNYLSQALCSFSIMGFIRRQYPHLQLVLGGSLVTSWLSDPSWRNPFSALVDEIVPGPGEERLLSLLGVPLSQGDRSSFSFDDLPLDDYLAPGRILPYSASVGCYWRRCSFCPEKAEGSTYVPSRPGDTVAELAALSARHNPALVHLIDNGLSPALLRTVGQSPVGTPWYGFARITADLADPAFCLALKRSGCVMLKVGLESGDQSVLDALDKGIDLDTAGRALRTLKRVGIGTYVYLLFGTPQEDRAAAERTMQVVSVLSDSIDFLNVAIFNLPKNSPDTAGLEVRTFYEGDLSLYADFVHPKGWDRREVRLFLDREFRRHPAVRPILLRQPPLFTSNHAPFFVGP